MIPLLPINAYTRPNRMVSAGNKGEQYHGDQGRWCIGSVNAAKLNRFRTNAYNNGKFFSGHQWILRDDIDTFLMDGSEDARNRMTVSLNIIKTVVEKFRGSAEKMTYNAVAHAVSEMVKTRKQKKFAKLMTMQKVAEYGPGMMAAMKAAHNIGDTEAETSRIFENKYEDTMVKALTHLITAIASRNQFGKDNAQDVFDLVRSGLVASCFTEDGCHMNLNRIEPVQFYYDTSAQENDLTDAEFMGYQQIMATSAIYEEFQCDDYTINLLENATRYNSQMQNNSATGSSRMVLFRNYFRDYSYYEQGFVMGEDGMPELEKINYIPPGAPKNARPRYTDEDLIPVPESYNELFRGQKKRRAVLETWRECHMIPWEYMYGVAGSENTNVVPEEKRGDLVLGYGLCTLQEVSPTDVAKSRPPIHASVYAIDDGEIVAPITDLLYPQRWLNRIISVTEQQMNNSGSRGVVLETSMLDKINEAEANRRIKRGETVPVDTQGRGAAAAIQSYDNTPGQGTLSNFQVVSKVVEMIRLVGILPEPVTGTPTGDKQLVGVTQLLTENSGVLDAPVYAAADRIKLQRYQHLASAGKQFYCSHPEALADMVNDDEMYALLISQEASLEQLLIEVQRSNTFEIMRKNADDTALFLYKDLQLLDKERFANLWGRGSIEDVLKAMREFATELAQAEKEAQRQQAKAAIQQTIAARQGQLQAQADGLHQDAIEATSNKAVLDNKRAQIYDRAQAKEGNDEVQSQNRMKEMILQAQLEEKSEANSEAG